MLGPTSCLIKFEFAEKGLYAACVLARETGFARIEVTVCVLVSIDKSSERSTTTPVAIYLVAAREKLTGDADFNIDLVIDVDTSVGWVTFPDTTVIEVPIHASVRPRIYTPVENAIP